MGNATIVFDLDGTLVDSAPDLLGALNWLHEREGLPPVAMSQARALIGAGIKPMIEKSLVANGRKAEELETVYRRYLTEYERRITAETRPYPGLEAALDRLAERGFRLAVCTNKLEYLAKILLRQLDMDRRFAFISGADTYEVKKPDARHLLYTIRDAGGEGLPAVMVGDSKTDIATAQNAALPVIGFTGGYTEIPLNELNPTSIIDQYHNLENAIDTILFA